MNLNRLPRQNSQCRRADRTISLRDSHLPLVRTLEETCRGTSLQGFLYGPAAVWQLNRMTVLGHRTEAAERSCSNMKHLKRLEEEVSAWPEISVHTHRFGGREFRFGSGCRGGSTSHEGGVVGDIQGDDFSPISVRDLSHHLAEGLADRSNQPAVPNSGWTRIMSDCEEAHRLRDLCFCGCPIFDIP